MTVLCNIANYVCVNNLIEVMVESLCKQITVQHFSWVFLKIYPQGTNPYPVYRNLCSYVQYVCATSQVFIYVCTDINGA